MKRNLRIISLLMAVFTLLPLLVPTVAAQEAELPEFGDYYYNFDFENYTSGGFTNFSSYFRSTTAKTGEGTLCNNIGSAGVVNSTPGGKSEIMVDEDGNRYLRHTFSSASSTSGARIGTFAIGKKELGNSIAIDFKFRANGSADNNAEMSLLQFRRGSNSGHAILKTNGLGQLYLSGLDIPISNPIHTPKDGEFTDISVRWYDATNTLSLVINGVTVVENARISTDLRDSKTVESWGNSFLLESLKADTTSEAIINICNIGKTNYSYSVDFDDIKIYDIATPEGLPYYYVNGFDGANSLTDSATRSDVEVKEPTHILVRGNSNIVKATEANGNSYVKISEGDWFGIKDQEYQLLSTSSWVTEFRVKNATHKGSKLTAVLTYEDGGLGNVLTVLYMDKDGNLYRTSDTSSVIPGVNISGDEWTHIAVLCVNDLSNKDSFGSFNSSTTSSTVKFRRTFVYYVNGVCVGSSTPMDVNIWNLSAGKRTLNGYDIASIVTNEGALDLSGLTLIDGTTTDMHSIYVSADRLKIYDVEYSDSEKTTQKSYSVMTLTAANVGGRGEYVGYFNGDESNAISASIDDVKLYAGNFPEFMTENSVVKQNGTLLDIDFGSYNFMSKKYAVVADGNLGNESVMGDVHGVYIGNGLLSLAKYYDKNGQQITDNYADSDYMSLSITGGWHDIFFPYSATEVYSFEHTLRNVLPIEVGKKMGFFTIRREAADGSYVASQPLMQAYRHENGDIQLYTHYQDTNRGRPLYFENGSPALLTPDKWQTIKVIYDESLEKASMPLVSFYLDGELLYLDNEGKEPAKDIDNNFNGVHSKRYTNNQRVRFYYADLSKGSLELKSFTIRSVGERKTLMNELELNGTLKDKVTVFEAQASFTPYTPDEKTYYPLIELGRSDTNTTRELGLVYVEPKSGALYLQNPLGGYDKLYGKDGTPIVLSESNTDLAVVYDDVTGLATYFVDGVIPCLGEEMAAARNVQVASLDFYRMAALSESARTLAQTADGIAVKVDVETYSLNYTATAETVALQLGEQNNDIRVLAGVDSPYYTGVGFDVELFLNGVSSGVKTISGNTIFSSVKAENEIVFAKDEYGYNYLVTAVITDIPSGVPANSFAIIRPFTVTGGVKTYGAANKILISDAETKFDESYTEKLLCDNADIYECSEIESFEGRGLAFNSINSILNFNADCEGKVFISLDSSRTLGDINATVLEITIDGTTKQITLPIGRHQIEIADLADGEHAFSIKKLSGGDFVRINGITLDGEFLAPDPCAEINGVELVVNAPKSGMTYGDVTVYVRTTDESGNYFIEYPFAYQYRSEANPYEGDWGNSNSGNKQYNVDLYRINGGYITKKEGGEFTRLYQVLQSGEIAVALRETKVGADGVTENGQAGDAIGGFHGDENITKAPEFVLDGVAIDLGRSGSYIGTTLEFVQETIMDRCNSTGENIIKHNQIYKIDTNGIRVKRSMEFLTDDYVAMKGRGQLQMFTFVRQDIAKAKAGDFDAPELCNTVNMLDAAGRVLHVVDTEKFEVRHADGTATAFPEDAVSNSVIVTQHKFYGDDLDNRFAEYIGDNNNGIYAKVGFNIVDATVHTDTVSIAVRKDITPEGGTHGDNKLYVSFTSSNDPDVCLDNMYSESSKNDTVYIPKKGELWNVDLFYYIDYNPVG